MGKFGDRDKQALHVVSIKRSKRKTIHPISLSVIQEKTAALSKATGFRFSQPNANFKIKFSLFMVLRNGTDPGFGVGQGLWAEYHG